MRPVLSGGNPAEDSGRLGVERYRVKFAFGPLEDFQPTAALGMLKTRPGQSMRGG
jgi:hypothetical protein